MRLAGRTALITGGASGIGRATALAMAREGASVAVLDIDGDQAARTARRIADEGGVAVGIECDVTQEREVRDAFASARSQLGVSTALFNNAGVTGPIGLLRDLNIDDIERCFAVNLRGALLVAREFLRALQDERVPATIVNTASVDAFHAEPGGVAYNASKGAVVSMTKTLALDHAREGIRVNCICPGYVDTAMTAPFLAEASDRHTTADRHPLGRIATPAEVAAAVIFLSCDDSSFTTGTALMVDGGLTAGGALIAPSAMATAVGAAGA